MEPAPILRVAVDATKERVKTPLPPALRERGQPTLPSGTTNSLSVSLATTGSLSQDQVEMTSGFQRTSPMALMARKL